MAVVKAISNVDPEAMMSASSVTPDFDSVEKFVDELDKLIADLK